MKMWIARNSSRALFLFPEKPRLMNGYNCWEGSEWYRINRDLFPEVTFENSPMEVELKLASNENN